MKTKDIIIIAVAGLIPLTAFSQPQTPPPAPPNPPAAPIPPGPPRDRDREDRMPKVPVTFLGVETSEVPSVLCDQLGLPKGFGLVVDYVVPDGPAAAAGVQQNDILKMFNDQILTEPDQLSKLVRSLTQRQGGKDRREVVEEGSPGTLRVRSRSPSALQFQLQRQRLG